MKKVFIIFICLLCASPCFAYSYCYKNSNGHKTCTQYFGRYGNIYPNQFPRYGYQYGYRYRTSGPTTVVRYNNAGAPISIQRGAGPEVPYTYGVNTSVNPLINQYPNTSGATFVFK